MPDPLPLAQFTSEWSRTRVVFGAGTLATLDAELDGLDLSRAMVVTTPRRTDHLERTAGILGGRLRAVCDRAALHVPIAHVQDALSQVDRTGPDVLIALGGGSPIGLAKAIALERDLPIVAIPTTYAGSEMTGIWGVTDGHRKRTGRNQTVVPRLVLYDPELTLSLPAGVSATSGMNAVAHAVEAMYAANAGPVAIGAAGDGLRALARALPLVVAQPDDLAARTLALRGAHAAGVALQLASMGLHHRMCHVLGGTFGLPHAPTHAAVLPHVVAFNTPAAPLAMAQVADAIGAANAAAGLFELNKTLGVTMSLSRLGLREGDLDRAAELVATSPYANPRPATQTEVRELLTQAM